MVRKVCLGFLFCAVISNHRQSQDPSVTIYRGTPRTGKIPSMNEPYQVAPNVWLLQDPQTARNSALVTADEGVLLIDAEPASDLLAFEQHLGRELAPILVVV